MNHVCPEVCLRFQCTAAACRHTCCRGWEIDIDEDALARYRSVPGSFGARLRSAVVCDEQGAHFRLTAQEACPLLRADGLCELILTLGQDSLCQICRDHPRFRNFFSDREEWGLGLCCEEAARLILSDPAPMRLLSGGEESLTAEEEWILASRERCIALMQDRSLPIHVRWEQLAQQGGFSLSSRSPARWAAFYRELERLDPLWDERLASLRTMEQFPVPSDFALPLEQLTVYFLYRHLPGALLDGDLPARIAFSVLSAAFVCALLYAGRPEEQRLAELAREYSAEIEYSEENLCALLDELTLFPQNLR